jgi:hypothetical protein
LPNPRRKMTLPLIRPLSVLIKCKIRRALALGRADVIESAVPDEMGEMERVPGCGEGDCTGEPSELIEGAEGAWVCMGTEARYSAPDEAVS